MMRDALDIQPNLIDRLVNYVSPVAGARRMQARYAMPSVPTPIV